MRQLTQHGGSAAGGMLAGGVLLVAQAVAQRYLGASLHKTMFPLDKGDVAGLFLAAAALFVAAGGGIGGGALLVPILLVIMSESLSAKPLSLAAVCVEMNLTSGARTALLSHDRH